MKTTYSTLKKMLGDEKASSSQRRCADLASFERQLKLELPPDYRQFCKDYGSSVLGAYLMIFCPGEGRGYQRYNYESLKEFACDNSDLQRFDTRMPGLLPLVSGGWLMFGHCIGDAVRLYWAYTEGPSVKWSIVLYGRDTFVTFACGFTEFIVCSLTGKLKCELLKRRMRTPALLSLSQYQEMLRKGLIW